MLIWTINIVAQETGGIGEEESLNPVQEENLRPGTTEWMIPKGHEAYDREIEGYASAVSVNVGETIQFFVHVKTAQKISIQIYRMGWYQGLGGRLITSMWDVRAEPQPLPEANHTTGLAECNWTMPLQNPVQYSWLVPQSTVSGVYIAKLTGINDAFQSYVPFTVRKDDLKSDYLFQSSVTTWQAYNYWPEDLLPEHPEPEWDWYRGKSLYAGDIPGGHPLSWGRLVPEENPQNPFAEIQARKVSFNRPYFPDNGIYQTAGQFFIRGEYNMVKWLEKEGYDLTYTTNVDIDAATDMINGPLRPGLHKVFLSVGHDEYWTWTMRDNIEQARNRTTRPLNLGFFGGNAVHWQIRFENSSSASSPANAERRTIVAYKHLATSLQTNIHDPYFIAGPGGSPTNYLTTNYWRENDVAHLGPQCPFQDCFKRPEDELVGVMTDFSNVTGEGDFEFYSGTNPPIWSTVGMQDTTTPIENIIGYEADRIFEENDYSSNRGPIAKIGDSAFIGGTTTRAHAVYYRINNAGRVFGAGTISWSFALDQFGRDPDLGPVFIDHTAPPDPRADILTRNILACLSAGVGCN
jgi:hypothetical protein